MLDYEFTPVGPYGDREKPTTLRNRILKDLEKQMVWRDGYNSEQSAYTKVIKKVLEDKLSEFTKQINKEIDARFIADCMSYAEKRLRERAGIK